MIPAKFSTCEITTFKVDQKTKSIYMNFSREKSYCHYTYTLCFTEVSTHVKQQINKKEKLCFIAKFAEFVIHLLYGLHSCAFHEVLL